MKLKKIIPCFLILVISLQVLPVRQVVRYFITDRVMAEDISAIDKIDAKCFAGSTEDHTIPAIHLSVHHYVLLNKTLSGHFTEVLPPVRAADIHLPPPNGLSV